MSEPDCGFAAGNKNYTTQVLDNAHAGNYIISLGELCKWLAEQVLDPHTLITLNPTPYTLDAVQVAVRADF